MLAYRCGGGSESYVTTEDAQAVHNQIRPKGQEYLDQVINLATLIKSTPNLAASDGSGALNPVDTAGIPIINPDHNGIRRHLARRRDALNDHLEQIAWGISGLPAPFVIGIFACNDIAAIPRQPPAHEQHRAAKEIIRYHAASRRLAEARHVIMVKAITRQGGVLFEDGYGRICILGGTRVPLLLRSVLLGDIS